MLSLHLRHPLTGTSVFHRARRIVRPRGLLPALLVASLLLAPAALHALTAVAPPRLTARSAILIEEETGKVLYAYHANLPYPPASLTKLITLQIVLDEIDQGNLSQSQIVVPERNAWAINQPKDSSLMFLGPNQKLSIKQLLEGLTIPSGNDAAVELADLVAGSPSAFVHLMNQEVHSLGFDQMHFVDPAGVHSENRITAREYAEFCRRFIRLHPEALTELLSVKKFVYPLPKNLTNGNTQTPIVQYNRNLLLWKHDGVDGLKTGYIDQSGYNGAITADRDGMRLIAVVLGIPGPMGDLAAERQRAAETESLLDWGFRNFTLVHPSYPAPERVRVWKSREGWVDIAPKGRPAAVVPRLEASQVTCVERQVREVVAPVQRGQILGHIVVKADGKEVESFPLEALRAVPRGGLIVRVADSIWLWVRGILDPHQRQLFVEGAG